VDAKRREQGQLRKELLALDKQLKKKETEIDKQVRAAGRRRHARSSWEFLNPRRSRAPHGFQRGSAPTWPH